MTVAALLLTAVVSGGLIYGEMQKKTRHEFQDEYKNYQKVVKDNNLDSLSTRDIIEDLWSGGVIDEQTYKKSLQRIDELEAQDPDNLSWSSFWGHVTNSPGTYREGVELYKTIATYAPYLNSTKAQDYDSLVKAVNNSFYTSLPTIADAPTPQYLDTMFEGTQVEVTDPKKWTAGELAELHNINYDMDYYYDLIKEGTEANIGVGEYTNRQLEALVNSQETKNVTSYLDSIRNAKAEALANGATSGARAAAEILANSEAIAANSQTQAQLANNKAQNMDALLQADAEAKLSARQYFDQIARSLTTDATNLYTYDVDRYNQELLTNADLYTADQTLRGARLLANAEMWAAQQQANAEIAANRSAMQAESDQYSWLFNNALRAYGGDTNKALHFVDDYIFKTYQGTNRTAYMNNTNV